MMLKGWMVLGVFFGGVVLGVVMVVVGVGGVSLEMEVWFGLLEWM